MGSPPSELRGGMRIEWDVPIAMDGGLVPRGADVFRPAAIFVGRYTLHVGPGRESYMLVPVIPPRR